MTVRQAEVIDRLKSGETLIRVLPRGDCASEQPYQYLSGGGRVTAATYRKLTPSLEPVSLGLFVDMDPQEWRWPDE